MTNDVTLVSQEGIKESLPPQATKSSPKKEKAVSTPAEKVLPAPQKETPVNKWIMPPEQQGYIQGNDKDCL